MSQTMPLEIVARVHTPFAAKFGIPRQSGIVPQLPAQIVFEPEYRQPEALRGIEEYSHLWLIWQFSENVQAGWSPTVRPPLLGGNKRMGVFATRSPFRPNPLGLSSVRLEKVELNTPQGPVLHISGADILDGTPLIDIKPYLAYTDSHPEASGGFTAAVSIPRLHVEIPVVLQTKLSAEQISVLRQVLAQDPRPAYQHDPARVYGFVFAGAEIKFTVTGTTLTVCSIISPNK